MLKKSASGGLASLRGSEVLEGIFRSPYLLASSLAAALLDSLFEHSVALLPSAPFARFQQYIVCKPSFSTAC